MTRENGIGRNDAEGTQILSDVADEVLAYLESNEGENQQDEKSQNGDEQSDSNASAADAGNAGAEGGSSDGGGPTTTRELIDDLADALPASGAQQTPGSGSNINAAGGGDGLAAVRGDPGNLNGGTGVGSHIDVAPDGGASGLSRDSDDVKNVGQASAEDALGALDRDAETGDLTGELESGFSTGDGTSTSGKENQNDSESGRSGSDGEGVLDLVNGPGNGGSGLAPGSRVMQDSNNSKDGNTSGGSSEGSSSSGSKSGDKSDIPYIDTGTTTYVKDSDGDWIRYIDTGSTNLNKDENKGSQSSSSSDGSGSGTDSSGGESRESSGDKSSIPAPGGSDPGDQPLAELGIVHSGSDASSNPGGGAVDPMGHGHEVGETKYGFGPSRPGGQPGGGAVDPMGHGHDLGTPESLDILPDAGDGNPTPEGGTIDPAGFDMPTVGVDPTAIHTDVA